MKKILITLALFAPLLAGAHGLVTTLLQPSGNYNVEFEYNTIGNVMAGDFNIFDVYLLDSYGNPVVFESSFVNISKANGEPVLVANVTQAPDLFGSARLSGILKDAGEYTAAVRFRKDGTTVGESKFNFTVDPRTSVAASVAGNKKMLILSLVTGIVVGFILALILKIKRPSTPHISNGKSKLS